MQKYKEQILTGKKKILWRPDEALLHRSSPPVIRAPSYAIPLWMIMTFSSELIGQWGILFQTHLSLIRNKTCATAGWLFSINSRGISAVWSEPAVQRKLWVKKLNPRYLWLFLRFPHSATDSSQTALHFSALLIFKALQKLPPIHPHTHYCLSFCTAMQAGLLQLSTSCTSDQDVSGLAHIGKNNPKPFCPFGQFGVANEQNLLVFGSPVNTLRGHMRSLAQQLDRSDCNSEILLSTATSQQGGRKFD